MKITTFAAVIVAALFPFGLAANSQGTAYPIPRIVQQNGRYALMVDGAPFLMLGAQANNSSDWPTTLPKVWPAIEYLHANTLEIPIYWEQFEPKQRKSTTHRSTPFSPRPARTTFTLSCFGSARGKTAASTTCLSG
jgi:hypothetical protein